MGLKDIYNIPTEPIRDKNWVMPFGKHKGTPLHELMVHDPGYIQWLQNNTSLDFHSDIMDEVEIPAEEQRLKWLQSQTYWGDNRNEGGGYGIWDDAGCHPGDPIDYC